MKQAKNLTALLLTVLLAFGMVAVVPVTVSAADDRPVEPIEFEEISTVEDLYMINFDLAGNYKLMNDIDLSEATAEGGDWDYVGNGWEPIGSKGIYDNSTPFTGTFDGNGFEIKGLRIDYKTRPGGTGDAYIGLFSANTGTIKNLTVSVGITTSPNVFVYRVGAIAGYNSGTIEGCCNKATVSASCCCYAGGIAGFTDSKGKVIRCYNTGNVSASYNDTALIYSSGITYGYGTVSDCYNTGTITANNTFSFYVRSGGISACNSGSTRNCYNIGTATQAISYGTVTNCYFLSGSGAETTGAKSLTNAQMKIERIYAGFDFDNVWVLDKNSDYPYPQLQNNRHTDSVVGIEISSLPDKVTYVEGEEFDSTGLEVVAVYENGTKKAVEDYQLTGFESVKGEQTVTVTFGEYREAFTVHVYELGDTNLDSSINVHDVTAIQRHIAELAIIDDKLLAVADANGDGVVTIDDATFLQTYFAEFETAYPIGEITQ